MACACGSFADLIILEHENNCDLRREYTGYTHNVTETIKQTPVSPPPPLSLFHISAPWKGDILVFRGIASSLLLIVSPSVSVWLNNRVSTLPVWEVRVNRTHIRSTRHDVCRRRLCRV